MTMMTEMDEIREVIRTAYYETNTFEESPELASTILYAIGYQTGVFKMKPLETRPYVIQFLKDVFPEDHVFWTMIEIKPREEDAE